MHHHTVSVSRGWQKLQRKCVSNEDTLLLTAAGCGWWCMLYNSQRAGKPRLFSTSSTFGRVHRAKNIPTIFKLHDLWGLTLANLCIQSASKAVNQPGSHTSVLYSGL